MKKIIFILLLLCASCAAPAAAPTELTGQSYTYVLGNDVRRFIDKTAWVVCWILSTGEGSASRGGISCLPLSETSLDEKK